MTEMYTLLVKKIKQVMLDDKIKTGSLYNRKDVFYISDYIWC